jgi:hypothetical protein
MVARRNGIALCLAVSLLTLVVMSGGEGNPAISAAVVGTQMACCVSVLMRFGLLALATAVFSASLLTEFPITTDLSSWYFGISTAALLVVLSLAASGFQAATAGTGWFREAVFSRE